jgi:hypothetical protein
MRDIDFVKQDPMVVWLPPVVQALDATWFPRCEQTPQGHLRRADGRCWRCGDMAAVSPNPFVSVLTWTAPK